MAGMAGMAGMADMGMPAGRILIENPPRPAPGTHIDRTEGAR